MSREYENLLKFLNSEDYKIQQREMPILGKKIADGTATPEEQARYWELDGLAHKYGVVDER